MRRAAALALTGLLLGSLLGGCTQAPKVTAPDLASTVDVDNPELRAFKAQAEIADCVAGAGGRSEVPAVTLPCLGGGPAMDLSSIKGPAVISLWASWCTNCRTELPFYARLAQESAGDLTVWGVDYLDVQPGAALTLLRDTGATFPQLADPGGALGEDLRIVGLPGLILVDAAGHASFEPVALDSYADLVRLVREKAGVTVAGR